MAIYRNVQLSFWTDPKVTDDFTPEDRYFYLYLLTNQHTNISGCYELSIRQMSIDTGYSKDSIEKLIDRMQKTHNVIRYSAENKEVLIVNWAKYNWSLSPKVKKSITDSIFKIKTQGFREFLLKLNEHIDEICQGHSYSIDTLSIEYPYTINTTFSLCSVSDSLYSMSENEKSNDKKKVHALEVDDLFESLWKLYVRKEGKSAVNKKAKEEIFKVGYDRMKKCIEHYAEEKRGCDKQYLLMGSTFFNGRYKDYLVDEEPEKEQTPEVTEEEDISDEEWLEMMKNMED